MFAPEPRIKNVPVSREQVVSIIASLNKPHIAVPGKPAQEVQGYIVGVANAAGTITVFVYLHLTETHDSVVYLDAERLRVTPAQYAEVESDAIGFAESMGFMLENLNYQALTPDQQNALVKTLPCFLAEPQQAVARGADAPERVDPPPVRMARFLAAF
ncbi:MAG TPA: hypothetical protein VGK67_11885 [Myxococcales bacterium]|jgi:hypothetical protein